MPGPLTPRLWAPDFRTAVPGSVRGARCRAHVVGMSQDCELTSLELGRGTVAVRIDLMEPRQLLARRGVPGGWTVVT